MIIKRTTGDITYTISELERVLPSTSYNRLLKNKMVDQGYLKLSEFARQNGISKQLVSHAINGLRKINIDIAYIRAGGTVFIKRI